MVKQIVLNIFGDSSELPKRFSEDLTHEILSLF